MAVVNLGVQLPGSGYKHISEFNVEDVFSGIPFKDGLVGAYFLTNQNVSPLINYADMSKPLMRVGNPVVNDKYTILDHANYYDTGLPSTETLSALAISLPSVSTTNLSGIILSNYRKDSGTNNIAQGDTLRAYSDEGIIKFTQYADFSMASPPSANITGGDLPANKLIISYGLVGTVGGGLCGISHYNPDTDKNVSNIYAGAYQNPRRVESERTLRIGTTTSDTEFLGQSAVSAVLIFNKDLGSAGLIANERWLHGTFGAEWGLW